VIRARHIFPGQASVWFHPIYLVESRVRHRQRRRQPSVRYILFNFGVISLGVLGLWIVLTVIRLNHNPANRMGLTDELIIFQTAEDVLNWSLFISVMIVVLLDTHSMTASLNSINREMISSHWNLLQLTNLNEKSIITAKYVLAQESTWRSLLWIVGLRISVVLLLMAQFPVVISPYSGVTQLRALFREFERVPVTATIELGIFLVILVVYLVEPFWRMHALTASGIMISARIRDTTRSILAALGIIGVMWFSQIALSLLYGWLVVKLLVDGLPYGRVWSLAVTLIVVLVYGLGIWLFYRTMQRASLRAAQRFAFARD
jgi:hypothetical protein